MAKLFGTPAAASPGLEGGSPTQAHQTEGPFHVRVTMKSGSSAEPSGWITLDNY